ncbi:MAG TPA: FG-GAP-like repeat-containing protein [Mycobacterium sp.]
MDPTGAAYPQPFLGGYDVPRPQLLDIDGDGDLDLFVQERSGEIGFFERDGDRWTWRTDRFHDLDVGEWYRFVDLDGDGDWDLLGEARYSYIKAWRNVGTRAEPRFEVAADSLRGADGRPIFADRQNILNLADIDCNGRLDLFLGRVTGTIDRFEAEPGLGPDGLPRFRLLTERWEGIEILGPVPGADQNGPGGSKSGIPNGSRHGANTMAFGDADGDGDLDLYWGDFFEQGILLIRNDGGCPHFSLRGTPAQFPPNDPLLTTGYNAPAPGDIDGDGDLDLILGVIGGAFSPARSGVDNLYLVEQQAPGEFRVVTSRVIPTIDVGSESIPALADIDGDGDLDLLLGNWRDKLQWWRNTGTATAPAWTLADSALVTITRGSNTAPALADLDGDGDLDLIIGEASGLVNLYRNTGSPTAPVFELVSDEFQQIDAGRRSTPLLADFDGDGKADLMLGSEDGVLQLWRNVTGGAEIRFERVTGFALTSDAYAAPAAGDLDGDGDLDLVVGTASGGLRYLERTRP